MHAEMTFITSNLRMGGAILKERDADGEIMEAAENLAKLIR